METGSSFVSASHNPHVLLFPLPVLGAINTMLKLGELLCVAGIDVTFLNSKQIHDRLVHFTDVEARFTKYLGFRFQTIPDGLPVDDPNMAGGFVQLLQTVKPKMKESFKELLSSITPQVDCVLGDGMLGSVVDVAIDMGIPVFNFRTISASHFWSYFCIPDMIEHGELPIKGNKDMDRLITKVPGMETFLRCRDLPSFCRANDISDTHLQLLINETRNSARSQGLILNTFEELEGPILSEIRKHCPKTYTIGPLHEHLKRRLGISYPKARELETEPTATETLSSSNSLWKVDRSCIEWLDQQPEKSVLYVSFGSIAVVTRKQLLEFWFGLVNSKQKFLWVRRPDSVVENKDGFDEKIPQELELGTRERGYIVEWAPQEEVLGHKAVGGFLTHSGWNSTLESIIAGVPMICWPYFADQQINSRFVGEVWKLGLDMKDVCDRKIVERMVIDLMVDRRDGFSESAAQMARLASKSLSDGGSSWSNLDRLIEDIRLMSSTNAST